MAAPANNGDSMVLDMATTVVALGKVSVFLGVCVCVNMCVHVGMFNSVGEKEKI